MAKLEHVEHARATKDGKRPTCGRCHAVINVGDPYFHWSSPSGSRFIKHSRCDLHRPRPSEMETSEHKSNAYAAQENMEDARGPEHDVSDMVQALEDAAETAGEIAGALRDGASNIVDGFGHETSQSEEMNERADSYDEWQNECSRIHDEAEGLQGEIELIEQGHAQDHFIEGGVPDCPCEGEIKEKREEIEGLIDEAIGACPE